MPKLSYTELLKRYYTLQAELCLTKDSEFARARDYFTKKFDEQNSIIISDYEKKCDRLNEKVSVSRQKIDFLWDETDRLKGENGRLKRVIATLEADAARLTWFDKARILFRHIVYRFTNVAI